jgi:macrolide-specific efflux system membrane fusion protein
MKKISKNKKFVLIGAVVLIILGIVVFVSTGEKINYLTEDAKMGDIKRAVNATGEVAAIELVSVGAQVSGQIEKLNVKLGQKVKKGDLIAQIDSTTQKNELDINKAKLKSYKAQLAAAESSLKVAASQYEREKDLAKKDFTSKANLEAAENNYLTAKSTVEDFKALIEQAEISVSISQTNLNYTTILAPFDGTIVSVPVKEGQTVNANQYTPTIVQMADLSQMAVLIQISEGDVTKIRSGMTVTYSILSEADSVYEAVLVSIDPGLTTLTNGAYTGIIDADTPIYYYGRAIAENTEEKLFIGMTTQNEIILENVKQVLIIPSSGIYEKEGKKYVSVLEKGKSKEREITVGISDAMYTQVLSGVKEGDKIIIAQTKKGEQVSDAQIF